MKFIILFTLLVLVSCSSTKLGNETIPPEKVSNESFKNEKPLAEGQVPEYYVMGSKGVRPALQDETLVRHSKDETSDLDKGQDPLISLSLLCSDGEFTEAFSLAHKIFQRYQKIATYWNQVANCHLNQGSHRKALLFYNKALEISPNFVPTLNNIGVLYTKMGQDQKALVAFERANKHARFAKTPRYNLAKLYLSYGLADESIALFNPLLESYPKDIDILNAVATGHFMRGDLQQSHALFQRIPKQYWSNPEIGLNASLVLKKLGKLQEAKDLFDSIEKPKSTKLAQYYQVVKAQLGDKG